MKHKLMNLLMQYIHRLPLLVLALAVTSALMMPSLLPNLVPGEAVESSEDEDILSKRVRYGPEEWQLISMRRRVSFTGHPDFLLLYASGGGFTSGGSPTLPNHAFDPWWSLLQNESVFLGGVGYGLAPEQKHPQSPEGDLRLAYRHVRENRDMYRIGPDTTIVAIGQSAGSIANLNNAVRASIPSVEKPDALILINTITHWFGVDLPFGSVWQHFEPGVSLKDAVAISTLTEAGAADFLENHGEEAVVPPPLWLHYSTKDPDEEPPFATLHDAGHGLLFIDRFDELWPGVWDDFKYRYTNTPGQGAPNATSVMEWMNEIQ